MGKKYNKKANKINRINKNRKYNRPSRNPILRLMLIHTLLGFQCKHSDLTALTTNTIQKQKVTLIHYINSNFTY